MADKPGPTAARRPEPMQWTVPVLDVHGRRRDLIVAVSEGRVVMLGPPGEAWTLPPKSDTVLFDAVRQARRVAREMGGRS